MIKRSLLSVLVIMVVLTSVYSVNAASYAPPAAPVINSFTSSATNVSAGDTIMLKWDVTGAESIEILGLSKTIESLPLKGELEVWPLETTTYVLNAYGPGYTMTTKSITVNVGVQGNVKIDYFTASKTEIQPGETVTLKFKLRNAVDYEIKGLTKIPECRPNIMEESIEVWPLETTSYILMAYGANGNSKSAVVTVTVADKQVTINNFSASPTKIIKGEKSKLSWNVSNAANIKINDVGDNLGAQGSKDVYPSQTTTYKLVATGVNGDVATATVVVEVEEPQNVEITSFTADKTSVSRGTLVKLSWTTKNAEGCMIVTSDGLRLMNRPANGSISITPNVTRTYTLIAYNGDDETAEKSITVTIK